MLPPILIGKSDFRYLRQDGGLYIDKSGFIREVVRNGADVQLYPRPRRFGKTLNLSMLYYYLAKGPDRSELFSDLAIWADASMRAHFQRYPTIYLTFKDIKHRTWPEARAEIRQILAACVRAHPELLSSPQLSAGLRQKMQRVEREEEEGTRFLAEVSEALALHHGERVVILIDEYDAPILTAWEQGYYEDATAWFRSFLSAGLKDNQHLFKGVLTGILRVARETMFSGLNNIAVFSLLHPQTGEHFGFTPTEVEGLLATYGRRSEEAEVQRWYNGYRFGAATVYNPWSILQFLSNPGMSCRPWWLQTSENGLIRTLLLQETSLQADIQTLLSGGSIEREVNESVPLRELRGTDIWSLFLFSGYLRADAVRTDDWGQLHVALSIPNQEVALIWRSTFLDWLKHRAPQLAPLHAALLGGDGAQVEQLLSEMLLRHVSSHDVKETQDEAFYHAFVLGLLVSLEPSHMVRSNREVGRGRADVLITPKQPGQPGVVLEFKKKEAGRTLVSAAEEALAQIQDRRYTTDLEAASAHPIHRLGIAFAGKEVVVRPQVV